MSTALTLKLGCTPAVITIATLASRRWGSLMGGWLIAAVPIQSGAIVLILSVERGSDFGAEGAMGALIGAIAQAGFALGYVRFGTPAWPGALLRASFAFAVGAIAFTRLAAHATFPIPLLPLFLAAIASLALCLRVLPSCDPRAAVVQTPPHWDLPLRAAVATAVVASLTAAAPAMGAQLAGVLATYPVGVAVMTVFADHRQGRREATSVLRGLMLGLYAFSLFFLTLAALLPHLGCAVSFAVAVVASVCLQGILLARRIAVTRAAPL